MSRKKNQKIKILRVLDILKEHRSSSNSITTKQMLLLLQEDGISCDRRTLVNDIETLSSYISDNPDYRFEICTASTSKGNAYYIITKPEPEPDKFTEKELKNLINGINNLRMSDEINKRDAENIKTKLLSFAPENKRKKLSQYAEDDSGYPLDTVAAKILIDSINSLSFMKSNVSNRIIDTIINMSDKNDKSTLVTEKNNPIFEKHESSNITLYDIDKIFRAIENQTKLSFRYFDLDENRNRIYRHDGQRYIVEPLTLTPNDNHYYLLCYDEETESKFKTYRIDRMTDVDTKTNGEPISQNASKLREIIPNHTSQIFRMYNGPLREVTLEFSDKLIGNVFDKFGADTKITRTSDSTCRITEEIQISPPFLGWLFQFSNDMKIISPQDVIEQYTSKCASVCGFET